MADSVGRTRTSADRSRHAGRADSEAGSARLGESGDSGGRSESVYRIPRRQQERGTGPGDRGEGDVGTFNGRDDD